MECWTMGQTWFQKLFTPKPRPDPENLRAQAAQGDADAQFSLGVLCSVADGQGRDLAEAARWYRQAADQNHPLAEFNLSLMFAEGEGVPQDDVAALDWLRRAAEHGDAGAQYNLGTRCHRASLSGRDAGAAASRIEAYKWLRLAALQDYKDAGVACAGLSLVMSREEIAEANSQAESFAVARQSGIAKGP